MKITRIVPTSPSMMAIGPIFDAGDAVNDPFFDYMRAQNLITAPSTSIEKARTDLDGLPDCPASSVWRQTMEATIALAEHDVLRPYDRIEFDTDAEQAALSALDDLAKTLRETSPLLDPVADILARAPFAWHTHDVGDVAGWVAAVTGDALTASLPQDGYCDKHEDYCYETHPIRSASWTHIEMIAPGTRQQIADLVAIVTMAMPQVGDADNGSARDPRPAGARR